MELRPYQRAALDALYNHLRTRDDNPCVVMPTGSGKTPLLAQICRDAVQRYHGRVLVISHVKELLEQAARHLAEYLPINMIGIHSAGLGRRDMHHPVIVAGIQSVYNKALDIMGCHPANLVIIDEAHRIKESGEGMYLTFLKDAKLANPGVRVIGLTATPFRLSSGRICRPENILNHVCYEANVKELIVDKWLSPLRSRRGAEHADLGGVRLAHGEFASDEMQQAFDSVIKPACTEIAALCAERQSVLIFAAGVKHAEIVARALGGEIVVGTTPKEERAAIIARFRRRELKYLVNVDVLTTGFDAPNVDAVILLRATMSAGLYSQMVGRGLRKCEEKTDCLILDYGENVLRHGPIDRVEAKDKKKRDGDEKSPAKECPQCHELIAVQCALCPNCEYEFPKKIIPRHKTRAGDEEILSGEPEPAEDVFPVTSRVHRTEYCQHTTKKDYGTSVTLKVSYVINSFMNKTVDEYFGFGHQKEFVRRKAAEWWRKRSRAPAPATVMDALYLIKVGAVAETRTITTKPDERDKRYERVVACELDEIPEWREEQADEDFFAEPATATLEEMPFRGENAE
ncbi:MAG: DEAD/DEAH box helicase [Planctomycetota bacterium]|jgi:DNA repair protein RadD|nr:DEAD/DEAH box helicase [Planctomycetota bacterium]